MTATNYDNAGHKFHHLQARNLVYDTTHFLLAIYNRNIVARKREMWNLNSSTEDYGVG